jgi:hypothetical protein
MRPTNAARAVRLGALSISQLWAMITAAALVTPSFAAPPPLNVNANVAGAAELRAFGARGSRQSANAFNDAKLDGALADLSNHAAQARPEQWLADLHAMSPAARFLQPTPGETPLILIDAIARGDPQQLRRALQNLGLRGVSVYANDVGGWLPITQISAAAASVELQSMRAAMPHTRTGAVESQGDSVQHSAALRTTYPTLTGTGITVGVLSDSYNCYAVYASPNSGVPASGPTGYAYNGFTADAQTDIATGDLPDSVDVLEEPQPSCLDYGAPTYLPFTDEGRAMMQVIHDVAPGAGLAFYTADNSEADFATGIGKLVSVGGAKVEADDIGYYDEPFFQDGILAQAIDAVEAQGVAYFSAAGNDAQKSWESASPSFSTLSHSGANAGEYLLNFDTSNATTATALPVTVPSLYPGEFIAVVVEWDQPYVTGAPSSPGASSQVDLCVTGATSTFLITDLDGNSETCTGPNATGVDPVQILIVGNPANASGNTASGTLNFMVGVANGTTLPNRVKFVLEDDGAGADIASFSTNSSTLQGHPGAAGAAAVGAAFYFDTPYCGTTPAMLETFSSAGGAPILFDVNGNLLATPVTRQKPDFVGPDGVNNTFLGYTLASAGVTLSTNTPQCENNANYPSFFGTSAATPHAAGIAALMLQANAAVTPTEIYAALRTSALPMATSSPNYESGYGFIQADTALAQLPPGPPSLTLSATSVAVGASSTLTWNSINTTGCTASGSWTGAEATSGDMAITTTAAGTSTYTLVCTNVVGTSTASSVQLSAGTAGSSSSGSSSGGGGGAIDGAMLLALSLLALAKLRSPAPTRWSHSGL